MENASGGMGFASTLTLIFITLKLTDVIAWSWWWVLAPAWIPLTIYAIILFIVFIGSLTRRTPR